MFLKTLAMYSQDLEGHTRIECLLSGNLNLYSIVIAVQCLVAVMFSYSLENTPHSEVGILLVPQLRAC